MIFIFLILFIMSLLFLLYKSNHKKPKSLEKAICIIKGTNITGLLYLDELSDGNTHIYGKIIGLEPGKHSINIYESGNMINNCNNLGSHYNPSNKQHGSRVNVDSNGNIQINYNRHIGDLGNLLTNKNKQTTINFVDPLIRLSGDTNVIGRSIAINKNDYKSDKIACGIIARLK